MSKIVRFSHYLHPWKEVLTVDNECSTLTIYKNNQTGELEVVQTNDDGESIRSFLNPVDAESLSRVASSEVADA